jgi:rubredoxin
MNENNTNDSQGSQKRMVRPDPRTFTHFPTDSKCPICGTNDDGKTVLVQIAGAAKDGIAEAKPMHLACSVAKQWDEGMGIAITWPNAYVSNGSISATTGYSDANGKDMETCSHKFIDSRHCLKCGWVPHNEKLRSGTGDAAPQQD